MLHKGKMKLFKISKYVIVFFIFSNLAQAATRPMMTLTGGVERGNIANYTNITFIPPFYNTYDGTPNYTTDLLSGLFLGAESDLSSRWKLQYGVSFYQNSNFEAHGIVNQFGDPTFANLDYFYQILNRRYLAETKLLYNFKKIFHPYINLGVGQSVNESYNYYEQPVSTADVPMSQPFANKIMHNFSYQVGIGVDADITPHLRLGAGYRYVKVGYAGLNPSPLQQDTTTITTKLIYTNQFLLQISLID